jgi:aspartate/tyrosine/aromatic aminotransferase
VGKLEAIRSQAAVSNAEYRFSSTYIEASADLETQGTAAIEPVQKLTFHEAEQEAATLPKDGEALLTGTGPLTHEEAVRALIALRETHIRLQAPDWEAHRSILRDGLIETFVKQRITEPEEWFTKVPQYLRSGTDGSEKRIFLERICGIIERLT